MNLEDLRSVGRYRSHLLSAVVVAMAFCAAVGARAGETNAHDLALLDRLTWGISTSSAEHLRSVGIERWLQEQLHPPASTALPEAANAQIEAMPDVHKFPFDIAVSFEQQAKSANQVTDPDQRKAAQQVFQQAMNDRARQAAARTILRALYAPDQLRERMVWFWFNHFNVHQYKSNLRVLVDAGEWTQVFEPRSNLAAYVPGDYPQPQLELIILLPQAS